jgi:NADH:ubiquinone oxidoreductase subunit E
MTIIDRKIIFQEKLTLENTQNDQNIVIKICVGTSCFVNGSQTLLNSIIDYIEKHELNEKVSIKASFCLEKCDQGPNIIIGDEVITHCSLDVIISKLKSKLGMQ